MPFSKTKWLMLLLGASVLAALVAMLVYLIRKYEKNKENKEYLADNVTTTAGPGSSGLRNNMVATMYSNSHEPMIQVGRGTGKTFAVLDTGSSMFWMVDVCKGVCKANLEKLCPTCHGRMDTSHLQALPASFSHKYGTCSGGTCAYMSCCPNKECYIGISPHEAVIDVGGHSVKSYLAVGQAASGTASTCGGMMGIMGVSDFTGGVSNSESWDKTSFLYHYFLADGGGKQFPTDQMNFSFSIAAPAPAYNLKINTIFQDTQLSSVQWLRRYSIGTKSPMFVVRLLSIEADGVQIFENAGSGQSPTLIILDTGTEQFGMFRSDIVQPMKKLVETDDGRVSEHLPVFNFVFEGAQAGQTVEWLYSHHEYMYDAASISNGKLVSGTTYGFEYELSADSMPANVSLAGNLFLLNKRVVFDCLSTRVGSDDLVHKSQVVARSRAVKTDAVGFIRRGAQHVRPVRVPRVTA